MLFRAICGLLCVSLFVVLGCSDGGGSAAKPETSSTGTGTVAKAPAGEDPQIEAAINELAEDDRALAKAQKFCAVAEKGRLGSMGKPVKLMIEGKPVFLCCEGCEGEAQKNPEETLAKVEKLKAANK